MPTPSSASQTAVKGRADLARLRRVSDKEIRASSPAELRDLPADFWAEAELVVPVPKAAISLRVDEDVLAWFREQGPRYQTRMNAVLRSYMEAAAASRTAAHRGRTARAKRRKGAA